MDWGLLSVVSGILITVIGGVFSAGIWLSRQFMILRNLVFDKHEQLKEFIIQKLDYHERHDDQRFNSVTQDLWEIRLRNAVIDGKSSEVAKRIRLQTNVEENKNGN